MVPLTDAATSGQSDRCAGRPDRRLPAPAPSVPSKSVTSAGKNASLRSRRPLPGPGPAAGPAQPRWRALGRSASAVAWRRPEGAADDDGFLAFDLHLASFPKLTEIVAQPISSTLPCKPFGLTGPGARPPRPCRHRHAYPQLSCACHDTCTTALARPTPTGGPCCRRASPATPRASPAFTSALSAIDNARRRRRPTRPIPASVDRLRVRCPVWARRGCLPGAR